MKNPILILIIVIIMAVGGALLLAFSFGSDNSENSLTLREAAQKAIEYINENILAESQTAVLTDALEESGLYKFNLKVGENEFDSYITKDGKLLFPYQAINLQDAAIQIKKNGEPAEIQKAAVPDVKLFIMSYCPYGLQAQKGFLPVYDLLKDKAKMEIYFVNYIMHGQKEIDENLRQYCIQKEQKEKYGDYLNCFAAEGDWEGCLASAGINKEKMDSCISAADEEYGVTLAYNDKDSWLNGRFPKFDVHNNLNEEYGVQGSPTFVINGQVAGVSRSPEKIKEAVCSAFEMEPEECLVKLSEEYASPGFGLAVGEANGGGCAQ